MLNLFNITNGKVDNTFHEIGILEDYIPKDLLGLFSTFMPRHRIVKNKLYITFENKGDIEKLQKKCAKQKCNILKEMLPKLTKRDIKEVDRLYNGYTFVNLTKSTNVIDTRKKIVDLLPVQIRSQYKKAAKGDKREYKTFLKLIQTEVKNSLKPITFYTFDKKQFKNYIKGERMEYKLKKTTLKNIVKTYRRKIPKVLYKDKKTTIFII